MLGWLGRKAILYVTLLMAILAYVVWSSGDIQNAWTESQTINLRRANAIETVVADAEARRTDFEHALKLAGARAQQATVAQLEQQITEAKAERDRLDVDQPSRLETMAAAATLDMKAVRTEHERVSASRWRGWPNISCAPHLIVVTSGSLRKWPRA